jgi:MYXO-CTERM domain-containing protein
VTSTINHGRGIGRRPAAWLLALAAIAVSGCLAPEQVEIEGRLQRLVLDAPDHTSRLLYVLEHGGLETELLFAESVDLPTGMPLRASGRYASQPVGAAGLGPPLVVADFQALAQGPVAQALIVDPARAPPSRKLLVLLVNFKNDDRQPISVDETRRRIFTDADSTRAFYKEQSYGLVDLVGRVAPRGDVYGWYTIDAFNRPCAQAAWADAALAAAKLAGVDTENYDHYVFLFPATPACPYLGLGQQPGRRTWINGASIATFTHELGHNVGTPHASARLCTDAEGRRVTLSDRCTDSEYGNPFDVMGAGFLHTHAYNKAQARWLSGTNLTEATEAGVYTLLPQERPSNGLQLLTVRRDRDTYFHLEYRRPFGFDRFPADAPAVSGLIVVLGADLRRFANSYLLDMNPATTTLADAPLAVGQRFEDPGSRVRFTLMSAGPDEARVRVEFAPPAAEVDGGDGAVGDAGGGVGDAATADAAVEALSPVEAGPDGGWTAPEAAAADRPRADAARDTGSSVPAPSTGGDGCGCAVGGRPSAPAAPLALVALIWILWRRRVAASGALIVALLLLVGGCDDSGSEGTPRDSAPADLARDRLSDGAGPAVPDAAGEAAAGHAGSDVPAEAQGDAGGDGAGVDVTADLRDGGDASSGADVALPVAYIHLYPVPVAVATSCRQYATIQCAKVKTCAPARFAADYARDEICQGRVEQTCRTDFLVPSRLEQPRHRTACARAIMDQDCRDFRLGRALTACQPPPGALALGDPCYRHSQCATGLRCLFEAGSCGTCQRAIPAGGDCGWWYGGCVEGTDCYDDRCLAPLRAGQACKTQSAPCEAGTACTATGCAPQAVAQGGACAAGDVCDPLAGLYCNLTTRACDPVPAPVAAGQRCATYSPEGATLECGPAATCFATASGVTAPRTCVAKVDLGQPCDTSKGIYCKAPGSCVTGLCVVPTVMEGGRYTPLACR